MAGPFTTPVAQSTPFEPNRNPDYNGNVGALSADNVQDAIEEAYNNAPGKIARYTITLTHNGAVGNGTFFGYSNLIPGDASPILFPFASTLTEFTFTNKKNKADYTLKFRKNSTTATPFYTVSKVNTQFFSDANVNETFAAGDTIFVQYQDDGANARDVGIVLFLQRVAL